MALLFPHLHLTVPVLATGAKGVSTRRSACVKALAFLHLGCPPQYRLCLLDCLPPTQVLSEWHSLEVITPCNIFRLGVTRINYHLALPNSAGEMEDFLSTQWESTSVRHAFIRKVYLILSAQLAVTFSVVAVFTFVDPVRIFVISYPGIYWASFVVYFVVYCILICCKEPRRRFPWNLVLLGVFVDFTSCGGFLCIAAVLLMIIGIVTAIVLSFQYVPWLHMLYAAIGAIVYTLFLVYNTQLLIGNRELAISPEEYVYGALSLYVDIVHIFLFILQVSGAATE
ncbi:protein lifeguard 3 isoform X3 [Haplochromis burtoni]|uniref:protein lifeguard 3 isoform X3 n=1 Tax=Haplochromis burtoni TaxID=8153 RepID=UPI001C2CCC8D|nr:protein lifeguard 3 isoform X3 [Haplochromis burtoni]